MILIFLLSCVLILSALLLVFGQLDTRLWSDLFWGEAVWIYYIPSTDILLWISARGPWILEYRGVASCVLSHLSLQRLVSAFTWCRYPSLHCSLRCCLDVCWEWLCSSSWSGYVISDYHIVIVLHRYHFFVYTTDTDIPVGTGRCCYRKCRFLGRIP